MADIDEIRKIFADRQVELGRDDVWKVQGVPVVKHRALERLAAKLAVKWMEPKVLRMETDDAVILVTGAVGDKVEWSIGEARVVPMVDSGKLNSYGKTQFEAMPGAIGNYQVTPKQSAYPFAMAEKRGKDRVIIKLAGLEAYSEEESDDFVARNRDDKPDAKPAAKPAAAAKPVAPVITSGDAAALIANMKMIINNATDSAELTREYRTLAAKREKLLTIEDRRELQRLTTDKMNELLAIEQRQPEAAE